MATQTQTRSATTTTTTTRVDTVLSFFTADLVGFIANDLLKKEVAIEWLRDLKDVLVLEAVERFQVKATFPSGKAIGLDYEVSDDGSIKNTDASGGFSTMGIPAGSKLGLVVRWRSTAPGLEKARELLRARARAERREPAGITSSRSTSSLRASFVSRSAWIAPPVRPELRAIAS